MPEKNWYFDTVSLSNFLFSGSDHLLKKRYHKCGFMTWEVYDEICAGFVKYPALQKIEILLGNKIFTLISLSDKARQLYPNFIDHLGKGEASCIAAAKISQGMVVTDDRSARQQCRHSHVSFTGTIGILKACVIDEIINLNQADIYLGKMIKHGFYSPVRSISEII
jgi:predicted nucleic acid-binding protein